MSGSNKPLVITIKLEAKCRFFAHLILYVFYKQNDYFPYLSKFHGPALSGMCHSNFTSLHGCYVGIIDSRNLKITEIWWPLVM